MKKVLALIVIGFTVLSFATAASAVEMDAGVKAGYTFLDGKAKDAFDDDLALGLYLNYNFTPTFTLQASWLWHKHSASDDLQALGDFVASTALNRNVLTDIRLTMNEFVLDGRINLSGGSVRPYLLAGLGLYYWTVDGKVITGQLAANDDESFWDFGLNAGVGIDFALSPQVGLGVEGTYTYVFDDFDEGYFNVLGTLSYFFTAVQ